MRGDDDDELPALAVSLEGLCARIERIVAELDADDGALWRALERIAENPHRTLRRERPRVSPAEARALRADSLLESLLEPGALGLSVRRPHFVSFDQRRWRFLRVVDERNALFWDTPPNRFVAHWIRTVCGALRHTARRLARLPVEVRRGRVAEAIEDARFVERRLHTLLVDTPALLGASRIDHVPHDNLVLRHDPRYRRVVQASLETL